MNKPKKPEKKDLTNAPWQLDNYREDIGYNQAISDYEEYVEQNYVTFEFHEKHLRDNTKFWKKNFIAQAKEYDKKLAFLPDVEELTQLICCKILDMYPKIDGKDMPLGLVISQLGGLKGKAFIEFLTTNAKYLAKAIAKRIGKEK